MWCLNILILYSGSRAPDSDGEDRWRSEILGKWRAGGGGLRPEHHSKPSGRDQPAGEGIQTELYPHTMLI